MRAKFQQYGHVFWRLRLRQANRNHDERQVAFDDTVREALSNPDQLDVILECAAFQLQQARDELDVTQIAWRRFARRYGLFRARPDSRSLISRPL